VNTNPSPKNDPPRSSAANKSKIVNRRAALGMAFRQAVTALTDARSKTATSIADKLKSLGDSR